MQPDDYRRMVDDLNRELDQLLYAISHDLRAPLRAIDGFSQAVVEDYGDQLDETAQDYLNRVRAGGRKINEYIDGLLLMSRESRGDIIPEEVNLSNLVREVDGLIEAQHCEHTPEFVVAENVTATMDRRLAKYLMIKLLDNAWKFTAKTRHPQVEFGQEDVDGTTAYFVRDNGAGFDAAYAGDRLFGAFQRMHADDEFPGLGTGLATAKRIVNRHNGRIWAESTPGEGTTIYFILDQE